MGEPKQGPSAKPKDENHFNVCLCCQLDFLSSSPRGQVICRITSEVQSSILFCLERPEVIQPTCESIKHEFRVRTISNSVTQWNSNVRKRTEDGNLTFNERYIFISSYVRDFLLLLRGTL